MLYPLKRGISESTWPRWLRHCCTTQRANFFVLALVAIEVWKIKLTFPFTNQPRAKPLLYFWSGRNMHSHKRTSPVSTPNSQKELNKFSSHTQHTTCKPLSETQILEFWEVKHKLNTKRTSLILTYKLKKGKELSLHQQILEDYTYLWEGRI